MNAEELNKTVNKDFSALTEENKENVIDMLRLLVLTQNNIVPKMLNIGKKEAEK